LRSPSNEVCRYIPSPFLTYPQKLGREASAYPTRKTKHQPGTCKTLTLDAGGKSVSNDKASSHESNYGPRRSTDEGFASEKVAFVNDVAIMVPVSNWNILGREHVSYDFQLHFISEKRRRGNG
jgi:hypothetical protein